MPDHAKFCPECGHAAEPSSDASGSASRQARDSAEGDRRHATVLFADISGYTALCAAMDAEQIQALLNRFFALMDATIVAYGGRIIDHAGDGVLAVFGAPVAHGNDPERATQAQILIRYGRACDLFVSPDGDRCEWLGVSREIALDIAASFDRRACDRCEAPFIPQYAPVGRELYLAQRALFARFDRNSMDALQAEEAIISLVTAVIGHAYDRFTSTRVAGFDARDDLVQRAKSLLSRNLSAAQSLGGIAVELGVSPFHLCRVFHERTGSTLHEFKTELRLRAALEMLGSSSLSRVAFELGFSSHSHFTSAMRTRFGRTPSQLRQMLA